MSEPSMRPSITTMTTVIAAAINTSTSVKARVRTRGVARVKLHFVFGWIVIGLILGNDPDVIAVGLIGRGRVRRPGHTHRHLVQCRVVESRGRRRAIAGIARKNKDS